jgi:hypothetical protein
MKNVFFTLLVLTLFSCQQTLEKSDNKNSEDETVETNDTQTGPKIQVALLLDTSNSMDGLIEQAKMRLWNIINAMSKLRYQGNTVDLEIALYEYGNDNLNEQEDWLRLVVPLSKDLDEISEKLFALQTNGGSEFCGSVIANAAKNLIWDDNQNSLRLIYIAGNEEFNQEGQNFKEALSRTKAKDIYVSTIYCGAYEAGVAELWRDGASLGQGKYFNIDSDQIIRFVASPYDDSIAYHNIQLNNTYVSFSRSGEINKRKQVAQDQANQAMAEGAYIERSIAKSKSSAYDNSHWDLVDKYKKDPEFVKKIKPEELPAAMKNKSADEIEKEVKKLQQDRKVQQKAIDELSKKREKYLAECKKNQPKTSDDLGKAIEKSIRELAQRKGYTWEVD